MKTLKLAIASFLILNLFSLFGMQSDNDSIELVSITNLMEDEPLHVGVIPTLRTGMDEDIAPQNTKNVNWKIKKDSNGSYPVLKYSWGAGDTNMRYPISGNYKKFNLVYNQEKGLQEVKVE